MPDRGPAHCNVCGAAGPAPIYRSQSPRSLTSLCQMLPGQVTVFFCGACGHITSNVLDGVEAFYEEDYRILIDSEEEDQVYETDGERIVYRTDHQMEVLAGKLRLFGETRLLDYGSAKGEMSRRLKTQVPGLDVHLFDVSRMYRNFWDRFVPTDRQAVHHTPPEWAERFDVVTSYFAFEHIPAPARAAAHVASLLRSGGVFYAIVPDTFGNIADFIVADHVNHFTRASLTRLLADAGFGEIDIDDRAHRGALVVVARKPEVPQPAAAAAVDIAAVDIASVGKRAREIARYWEDAERRLRQEEARSGGRPAAIYGAGFYGAFIYSHLAEPERVAGFIDRNPFQQGRSLFEVPILAPDDLPADVETLYVGLNPAIAREALAGAGLPARPNLTPRFLDGAP